MPARLGGGGVWNIDEHWLSGCLGKGMRVGRFPQDEIRDDRTGESGRGGFQLETSRSAAEAGMLVPAGSPPAQRPGFVSAVTFSW